MSALAIIALAVSQLVIVSWLVRLDRRMSVHIREDWERRADAFERYLKRLTMYSERVARTLANADRGGTVAVATDSAEPIGTSPHG